MKCNVGPQDKMIRLVASVVLIVAGIVYRSMWGLLGIPLVVTAIMGYCPMYALFKFSTVAPANDKNQSVRKKPGAR